MCPHVFSTCNRNLSVYNLPQPGSGMPCLSYEPAFFEGRCLLTLGFDQFRVSGRPSIGASDIIG